MNTLWGNSVPYVCWHQELVCCDHKSAPTVILILKCPRFIPCPPLLSCMFMELLLTVIRSPWKSSCGLFSDLCRSFRFSVKWSHWVYSCCALIPLDPSYVKLSVCQAEHAVGPLEQMHLWTSKAPSSVVDVPYYKWTKSTHDLVWAELATGLVLKCSYHMQSYTMYYHTIIIL